MKKRSLFFKVPAALAFAYVCITNIQRVLANKGCLSITDLESMTSANAACENIPSKNNGDCVENDGVTRCDQSTFWHDCYR